MVHGSRHGPAWGAKHGSVGNGASSRYTEQAYFQQIREQIYFQLKSIICRQVWFKQDTAHQLRVIKAPLFIHSTAI